MSALSSPSSPVTPVFRVYTNKEARWDAERDTDTLFQNHSVEEIRKIERRTRNDIQIKKEELRQMVGERYRDLLGAADSISDMMACSKQAYSSLANSQQLCNTLLQTHKVKGTGAFQHGGSQSHEQMCLGVSHMKLLVGIQGKIWSSIDAMDYQQAAVFFLRAKRIVSQLCLESVAASPQKSLLAGVAVVLLQQWNSIRHFQTTILDCCKQSLKNASLDQLVILQSLLTMVTLDHISTRQAFNEFLIGRKAAMQLLFHPSQQAASVKTQLCVLVNIMKSCVLQTAGLFCRSSLQDYSTVVATLNENLQLLQEEGLDVPATPTEISQSALHSSCKEWLTKCLTDIQTGVSSLLHHITSVKSLVVIRDAIHDILSERMDEIDWDDSCDTVLGRKLCIWSELLQPSVFARTKVILEGKFSTVENSFADLLNRFLDHYPKKNSTSFLWKEDEEVASSHCVLTLKATGCSPYVYRFCMEFNEMLVGITEEVEIFVAPVDRAVDKSRKGSSAFDKYSDSDAMYQFVQERTLQLVNRFLDVVSELKPKTQPMDNSSIERLLALGQMCQGLRQHCPLLSTLSQGCRPAKASTRVVSTNRPMAVNSDKVTSSDNGVMVLLHQMFTSIYRVWCDWIAIKLTDRYSHCLLADGISLGCAALNWEEVKISEETEGGNTVESVIRVPAQASCYVTNLLFVLCQQLAVIRGHSLDKDLLLHIGYKILKGILVTHGKLLLGVDSSGTQALQNCALQLLFDIRFLSNLLPHTSTLEEGAEDLSRTVQEIETQFENLIDPFDLDVFRPHLSRNLDRHHQRCSVMLGSISSLNSSSHIKLKSGNVSGVSQEKHNVIPTAPSIAAFTSLPVLTPSLSQDTTHFIQDIQAPHSIDDQMNYFLLTVS
ncbi:conserved oligomeric Golgi complex subunit 1-like [Dysidea avara]|uniref:conserved oligomeric Golgi complex subunit 1-like n=1 Tax=Dysidea avara TaxID=196820 RepID=UPI00332FD664